jgi:hypothetical protein
MKRWSKIIGTLSLLAAVAFPAGSAWANTAAGVSITNNATLTYNGGVTATSSVSVTVALKPSNPNITISGGSNAYTGANTPGILQTVVITATANGQTDYNVSVATAAQSNNSNSGSANIQTPYNAAAPTSVNAPQLGATVTTGTSGTTYVTVPITAGAANGVSISGITISAHILVINGSNSNAHEVAVTGIVDQGNGTYQIQWSGAIPAGDVPSAGVVVGERRVLNFYAYPGTVQASGTPISADVNATATNNSLSITTTTPAANSWTTTAPTVSFLKYVRNVTNAVVGNGGSDTFGVATYYRNNVTAKPGEILEYLVVATNTDATNPLTGCTVSDVLPTATYAAFVSNAYGANKDITYSDTSNTVSNLQAYGSGTHQATLVGQNLNVKVGNGANDTTAGDVPATKTVKILYQLTIN